MSCIEAMLPTLGSDDEVLVVVDPASSQDHVDAAERDFGHIVRFVRASGPFSFSQRVNLGVASSDRDVVVLLNDDTSVIDTDWLDRLGSTAVCEGVGAVGPTLLYEDGSIQHAGLSTIGGLPTHAWAGWDPDDVEAGAALLEDRVVWAVTGACLAVSRKHWDLVGGFSPLFPVNYNDVDFCCKLAERGLANVALGTVRMFHYETRTRQRSLAESEVATIRRRWAHRLGPDALLEHPRALEDHSGGSNG